MSWYLDLRFSMTAFILVDILIKSELLMAFSVNQKSLEVKDDDNGSDMISAGLEMTGRFRRLSHKSQHRAKQRKAESERDVRAAEAESEVKCEASQTD